MLESVYQPGSATSMESEIINVLSDLVRINSVNPTLSNGPGEEEMGNFVAQYLTNLELETKIQRIEHKRENVVAVIPGMDRKNSLLLNAHLDTVGTEEMDDPFNLKREGDRFYGRGAYDMKGSIAIMLLLAKYFSRYKPSMDILLTFVADEEDRWYKGFQIICEDEVIELQEKLQTLEIENGITPLTKFSSVNSSGKFQIIGKHIKEMRDSVEKLLTSFGLTKIDYFNYDEEGNHIVHPLGDKIEWTDPITNVTDLQKFQVKYIHIEDLRHYIQILNITGFSTYSIITSNVNGIIFEGWNASFALGEFFCTQQDLDNNSVYAKYRDSVPPYHVYCDSTHLYWMFSGLPYGGGDGYVTYDEALEALRAWYYPIRDLIGNVIMITENIPFPLLHDNFDKKFEVVTEGNYFSQQKLPSTYYQNVKNYTLVWSISQHGQDGDWKYFWSSFYSYNWSAPPGGQPPSSILKYTSVELFNKKCIPFIIS